MELSLSARMRLRPPGPSLTQPSKIVTGFVLTNAAVGDRREPTRSSTQAAIGTIPDPRTRPENEPEATSFLFALAGSRTRKHCNVLSRRKIMKATQKLHEIGQSLWLDNITRGLLTSGTLHRYIQEFSVTGLTSNPTIFDHAIKNSDDYDDAIL
jgi:hypothetical protein